MQIAMPRYPINTRYIVSALFALILGFSSQAYSLNSSISSDQAHKGFDAVLQAHVKDGYVDYPAIQKDARFSQYIDYLATAKPRTLATDAEQLAFWINAYNALTIQGILNGKSPSSLLGRYSFFISTKYPLAGEKTSLDDLEKKIIIPYGEPLIHFAIVCASASCPKLISEAYTAENLQAQMLANAKVFLKNPEKNKLDVNAKKIRLSKIFKWFKDDFAEKSGSVQQYIAPLVEDAALADKLKADSFKVKYLKYDWSLNGIAPLKQVAADSNDRSSEG